jgi:RND family efflux transporter MFP subunit
MKIVQVVTCGLILGSHAGCEPPPPSGSAPTASVASRTTDALAVSAAAPSADVKAAPAQRSVAAPLKVLGRTRCILSRRGIIAAAVLRPVVEVLVRAGDRVKKGQALIKLYDLEPQAKVRAREQDLRSIQARALYSRRNLELADSHQGTAAVGQRNYNDLRATALSNQALALAAEAELSHAQAELKLYTVTASIDGEIAWLDVSPGTVSWPGAMTWGEIVDLREIDIWCDLAPIEAAQVAVGQSADVALDGKAVAAGTGKIILVGKMADRNTGLVPVVVRMVNSQEQLRAEVAVKVRFQTKKRK